MVTKKVLLIVSLLLATLSANAKTSRAGFDLGIAYDLDLGASLQFNQFTIFANSDAVALDVRLQNFYNDRKTINVYIDLGGFYEQYNGNNADRDDRAGIRLPIGLSFGLNRNLEGFIQAVPSIDFGNDNKSDVDGALGIRYRF